MGRYDGLIHATLRVWLMRQRAAVGIDGYIDPILQKSNWTIGIGLREEDATLRFLASFVEHEFSPTYNASVWVDTQNDTVIRVEWCNPDHLPDAVKAPPAPPPNFGVWS